MLAPETTTDIGGGSVVVARSDAQATNSATRRTLYKARVPIYPKGVKGLYRRVKWIAMGVLLAIYYLLPFVRWDRGPGAPDQAVLVDFAHERFYFFFIEIWPQEVYYITGLLILAALGLFLVTAALGRVWCGYACPQTVWTDLFIFVERLIEGERAERIRLAKSPWTPSKVVKRVSKHAVWLVIAAATGGAWIIYFHDAPSLLRDFFVGEAPTTAYVFAGLLTFTTYTLAGFMREQVCTYMCPWPRIQAAMTDQETLSVTYRSDRGEPRGAHKKGASWDGRGSCIDCNQCVAACPMGIDIRDGDQLECINCALCIDACDDVMAKVGLPKGLIAYDTALNVARRKTGQKARFRFVRSRTIAYAVVLFAVTAIMLVSLGSRSKLDLNVLRDRNPVFVMLSDGSVRNAFTVKILNRANLPRNFTIAVDGLPGATIKIVGSNGDGAVAELAVEPDSVRAVRLLVTVPPGTLHEASTPIDVVVSEIEGLGEVVHNPSVFLAGE